MRTDQSTIMHAPNSRKFVATGGVELLKFLNINSSNFLYADKATQMQTNVINVLANTLAAAGGKKLYLEDSFLHNTSSLFVSASRGMRSFAGTSVSDERSFAYSIVMLCTANNSPARQAAALLLGNLACSSRLRIELGRLGAVEALWRITRGVRVVQIALRRFGPSQISCGLTEQISHVVGHYLKKFSK